MTHLPPASHASPYDALGWACYLQARYTIFASCYDSPLQSAPARHLWLTSEKLDDCLDGFARMAAALRGPSHPQ